MACVLLSCQLSPSPLHSLCITGPVTSWRLLKIAASTMLSKSTALVALSFLVNAVAQTSLLSILPFLLFILVIGVQYPKPSWRLWYTCMVYMALVSADSFPTS